MYICLNQNNKIMEPTKRIRHTVIYNYYIRGVFIGSRSAPTASTFCERKNSRVCVIPTILDNGYIIDSGVKYEFIIKKI